MWAELQEKPSQPCCFGFSADLQLLDTMHRVIPFPVLAGCCKSEHFLEKCGNQSWREELSQEKLTVVPAAQGYVLEPISTTIIILMLSPWTCDRQHGIVGNIHGEISAVSRHFNYVFQCSSLVCVMSP